MNHDRTPFCALVNRVCLSLNPYIPQRLGQSHVANQGQRVDQDVGNEPDKMRQAVRAILKTLSRKRIPHHLVTGVKESSLFTALSSKFPTIVQNAQVRPCHQKPKSEALGRSRSTMLYPLPCNPTQLAPARGARHFV